MLSYRLDMYYTSQFLTNYLNIILFSGELPEFDVPWSGVCINRAAGVHRIVDIKQLKVGLMMMLLFLWL